MRGKRRTDLALVGLSVLLAASVVARWPGGEARAGGPQPPGVNGGTVSAEAGEFFEARVRPILAERCLKCHGPEKQSSGLRLDSRAAVLKGGDSGPAVVPGKPAESLLIHAVEHRHGDLKMPPKGRLAEPAVAMLRQWVAIGVPWANEPATRSAAANRPAKDGSTSKTHWAFQPVRRPVPPAVRDRHWVDSPIDAFVLARLEAEGIAPSPRADKRTLIRRATIDLWGIPPTAEEIDAFEADSKPGAFERLIDRLLASPRYGERWGRHWLDVARYADTKGYVFTQDRRYPYAYTYRDYVVAAFNADLGYDQFILQQIAADQLSQGADRRPLAAMGFLTVGRRFLLDQNEIIDDRIDVVSRGLLGLTVTCARCHDHKFDPIASDDYYALYGVFASSIEPAELPLLAQPGATSPESADFDRKLKKLKQAREDYLIKRRDEIQKDLATRFSKYLKAAYDLHLEPRSRKLEERALADGLNSRRLRGFIGILKRHLETTRSAGKPAAVLPEPEWEPLRQALFAPGGPLALSIETTRMFLDQSQRGRLDQLNGAIEQLRATHPGAPSRAMVLNDAPRPYDPHVFIRGNPGRPGKAVPRRFLRVLAGPEPAPFRKGSGRLELAEAIASARNPLTARVFVNRVWQWHFGKGLVATPSDFGTRSDPPSHPELLDYLASEFMASSWSPKALHRLIMLSSTYEQSSTPRPQEMVRDPENRLLWRFNRQRLDFEAMRDSLLAVSGALDARVGGRPVQTTQPPMATRRTLYGFIDRQNLDILYRTFDFAVPDASSPRRFVTTVPQQALFLMNSPFMHEQARRVTALIGPQAESRSGDAAGGQGDAAAEGVRLLYRRVLGRSPDSDELALATAFIRRESAAAAAGSAAWRVMQTIKGDPPLAPWEQLAQVLLLTNEFMFVD
ncbi:MAG: PSD1 and planctomycete cytochrome C domain-containing protein [Isosphaeraceae bacterium]